MLVRAAAFTALALAGLAGPALAQDAPEAPLLGGSLFPIMGPDASGSQINAQLDVLIPEGEGDGTIKHFAINGQFMGANGMGGYAAIAGSQAEDTSALGSLEVGALWNYHSAASDVGFRLGLVLPTAGEEDADLNAITTMIARPADVLTAAPEVTTLRLAITPSARSGNLVARADVGLDIVLDSPGEEGPDMPYMHIDLGAGYDNGKGALLFELSNMLYLEDTDLILHTAAVTAAFHAGQATPYATIGRPFGDLFGGDYFPNVTVLSLGVRGSL